MTDLRDHCQMISHTYVSILLHSFIVTLSQWFLLLALEQKIIQVDKQPRLSMSRRKKTGLVGRVCSVRELKVLLNENDFLQLLAQFDEVLAAFANIAYALIPFLSWRVLLYLEVELLVDLVEQLAAELVLQLTLDVRFRFLVPYPWRFDLGLGVLRIQRLVYF